jgi:hypothetical protein
MEELFSSRVARLALVGCKGRPGEREHSPKEPWHCRSSVLTLVKLVVKIHLCKLAILRCLAWQLWIVNIPITNNALICSSCTTGAWMRMLSFNQHSTGLSETS